MDNYIIRREGFSAGGGSETLFAVSNGYFGVRGTSDELFDNEQPGCFLSGIYDKSASSVAELVNFPYPFGLRLYINREPFDIRNCKILSYVRELDMKTSSYRRMYTAEDASGRRIKFESTRFASMAERYLGASQTRITCENFSGLLNIESFIGTDVFNQKNNPNERSRHFTVLSLSGQESLYTECRTTDGDYTVGLAVKTVVTKSFGAVSMGGFDREHGGTAFLYDEFEAEPGAVIELERYAAFSSSRELPEDMVEMNARQRLARCAKNGFDAAFFAHKNEMEKLWSFADIKIEGDREADKALRYSLYSLICAVNPNDEKASLSAGGLRSEAGKGHITWETEAFAMPFFTYHLPEYAKSMLSYRYHTLEHAIDNAAEGGADGARFPSESTDTGWESAPRWGYDKKCVRTRLWSGDIGFYAAGVLAYAIREYGLVSSDGEFIVSHGTEMAFETARFWASRLEYNDSDGRYHINDVAGPDNFHSHIDDNALTNGLARLNLDYAAKLSEKLGIYVNAAKTWRLMADKVFIPKMDGLVEQFAGFFALEDRPDDWDGLEPENFNYVSRADAAAFLGMFYNEYSRKDLKTNYDFYRNKDDLTDACSEGVYALLGARSGESGQAYEYFMGSVKDKLSVNAAGSSWRAMVHGFCGISVSDDGILNIDPMLPEKWDAVSLNISFQGRCLNFCITKEGVDAERLSGPGINIFINGREREV